MNEEIHTSDFDSLPDAPSTAVIKAPDAAVAPPLPPPEHTPESLRTESLGKLLDTAYQRASELKLQPEEDSGLAGPFPDEAVEIRPHDGLLWIPHIHISRRLSTVLGRGQWALVTRKYWLDGETNCVYADCVMLIRGCLCGESIGAQSYIASNRKMNLSDAVEGAQSEALRRIAGKRLNCGDQVWDPGYCRAWVAKYAQQGRDGKWYRRAATVAESKLPAQSPTDPVKPAAPAQPTETPEHRKQRWLEACIKAGGGTGEYAEEVLVDIGVLLPNEHLVDLPFDKVPTTKRVADEILQKIRDRSGVAVPPVATSTAMATDAEPWRSFIVPFGKHAGVRLEDVPKNVLFGFWANHTVETEYNGKPRAADKIAKDRAFRAALDEAGKHYEFKVPDDKQPQDDVPV